MVSRVKVEIKMTSWCVAGLRRVITDLSGRSASVGTIDAALNQLEIVYRELVAMDALGELDDNGVSALGFTGHAIEQVRHILQSPQRVCSHAYFSPLVHDGTVGRPRYDVPVSTLESLVYSGFTGPQIAEILCLSVRTVRSPHRRRSSREIGNNTSQTGYTPRCHFDFNFDPRYHSIPMAGWAQAETRGNNLFEGSGEYSPLMTF